jgi:hypothetical protein
LKVNWKNLRTKQRNYRFVKTSKGVLKIIKDDPNNKFFKGQMGTVLEMYSNNHYEIEISDDNGVTIFTRSIPGVL